MIDYLVFFLASMAWFQFWYFVPNGFFYWLFWRHKAFDPQRIQADRNPRPGQIRTEILRSIRSLTIYAAIATFCYWCFKNGYSMVDWEFIGSGKVIISTLVLMFAYDTWFYWIHRLIHWKPLYRRIHKHHHESLTPTPWASYSFSMAEAVLQCPLWILCFVFPSHPMAVLIGLFIQNIYDTFGHLGYEFFPRWMLRNSMLCSVQATPTHHDAHHRYMLGNYGHYFNIWDFCMRTELSQYRSMREEVYDQTSSEAHEARPGSVPQREEEFLVRQQNM